MEEPNADFRDYFLVALLTGARRADVLAMCWEQINFACGTWTIPTTKNGESHSYDSNGDIVEMVILEAKEKGLFPFHMRESKVA